MRPNIHYNGKDRLERYYNKIVESAEITAENKALILKFYELCKAKGLSNARLSKTLWITKNLGIWIGKKSFATATKDDMIQLVNFIQDKYPKQSTITDYKTMLKKFYRNMLSNGKVVPEVVEWINLKPIKEQEKINPSNIFLEEDILRILQAESNPTNTWAKIRNKAMVAFLYDSGVRVGELLTMHIGDIKANGSLWNITVRGKTGQRTFPIFPSIPYLKDYLNIHPRRDDDTAFLWCSFNNVNQSISYQKVRIILHRAVRRAGINKPFNPHNFRHSAVTRDAAFMSDQKLKRKYGWTKNSEQLAVYSHIRLEDLEDSYRKHYNLEHTKEESKLLKKLCPFCHAENKPHDKFCIDCKKSLDIKDILEAEEKRRLTDEVTFEIFTIIAEKYPDIREAAKEVIRQKGLEKVFKIA
jgi:site-specific recombinase XerD